MKRLAIFFALILLFSSSALAANPTQPQDEPSLQCLEPADLATILDAMQLAKSGCCSWHGGVCGCVGGRAKCCDGTLSPSCGCRSEDVKIEN